MKIAVIGSNSLSMPELFNQLNRFVDLPKLEFILVSRTESRMKAILRASRLLLTNSNQISINIHHIGKLDVALESAAIVVVQARIGGYEGRTFDESFSLKYGICGDQDLGPGAISAGWRVWPGIRTILSKVSLCCPSALVVMLSSPVSLLVRAARYSFPSLKIVGCCELPLETLQKVSYKFNISRDTVRFEYHGINHFGWFFQLSAGNRDLILDFRDEPGRDKDLPSASVVHDHKGIPTRYVRLHTNHREVLSEQQCRTVHRGVLLELLRDNVFRVYESGNVDEIREALLARPAPWYELAVLPLIIGTLRYSGASTVFLSVPNNGYDHRLLDTDIIEIPHFLIGGKAIRKRRSRLVPARLWDEVMRMVCFERSAMQAIVFRQNVTLRRALALHPWVAGCECIDEMATEITESSSLTPCPYSEA